MERRLIICNHDILSHPATQTIPYLADKKPVENSRCGQVVARPEFLPSLTMAATNEGNVASKVSYEIPHRYQEEVFERAQKGEFNLVNIHLTCALIMYGRKCDCGLKHWFWENFDQSTIDQVDNGPIIIKGQSHYLSRPEGHSRYTAIRISTEKNASPNW